jgi:hypothetical protein
MNIEPTELEKNPVEVQGFMKITIDLEDLEEYVEYTTFSKDNMKDVNM